MLPFPVVIRAQSYDEYHDNASIIRYIIVNAHTILMYVTPAESGDSSLLYIIEGHSLFHSVYPICA